MIENTIIVDKPSIAQKNTIDLDESTDQSLLALVKKEEKTIQKTDNQPFIKNKKETLSKPLTQKTNSKTTTSTKKNTSSTPSQNKGFDKKKKIEKVVSKNSKINNTKSNAKNHILTNTSKIPVTWSFH